MDSVAVRMYHVGFGDAFLVTVRSGDASWRMLIDCGRHMHSQSPSVESVVAAIVEDLRADGDDGTPRLDVVVATHRHADHISGFAEAAWQDVHVGEVWLPFSEDPEDPDTQRLGAGHAVSAGVLLQLLGERLGVDGGQWPAELAEARAFALNVQSNARAMDRLLGRNGLDFANTPSVRYLPHREPGVQELRAGLPDVTVHVLGPPRTAEHLRDMEPPKHVRWLRGGHGETRGSGFPLFNDSFVVQDEGDLPEVLVTAKRSLALHKVDDDEELLAAASVLERAVNNTSIFLVLQVGSLRLLFPGDAQQGAWDHVLDDPARRALVTGVDFYKIGHHGSHNATPRAFVEEVLGQGAWAMLPWGLVKRWRDSIPKAELMAALEAHGHHVVRAEAQPPSADGVDVSVDPDGRWSQLMFAVRE